MGAFHLTKVVDEVKLALARGELKCIEATTMLVTEEDIEVHEGPFLVKSSHLYTSFEPCRKSKELGSYANMNLISMSTPYMLHLHPVTIPSSISDTAESKNTKLDNIDIVDGSVDDGIKHILL
ncbi:hypothetical protein POM88_030144 [Heracleum sosnowskyi]|uniref:Uncharacterized protein n=1 Tax=Heracleum sosnowskyi TaxID=360622 RepID=A0AAD8MHU7_9APIA|nr:hypothetical protein POM88_030144 [Heracleum sosnowskyi]